MAKNRHGKKKGKKAHGHRKSAKRVAAGKKAWRKRVKRFGSKAAAVAHSFGKRGRRGKKGRRRVASRFSKATTVLRRIAYDKALVRVKTKLGTLAQPPTEREVMLAKRITRDVGRDRRGPVGEEAARLRFKAKIASEARAEAARRAAEKRHRRQAEEAAEKAKRAKAEAEQEVEAEMRGIL